MGSAPVRRGFESLLGSSVRRGAPVGPGMPGVYRVTRSRTTQAQSLRRARPNPNTWIQPPDQEDQASTHFLQTSVTGNLVSPGSFPAESVQTLLRARGVSVGGTGRDASIGETSGGFAQFRPIAEQTNLVIPLPVPTTVDPTDYGYPVPPTATGWEFESPNGVVIGTGNVTGDMFFGALPGSLRLVADASWDDPSTSDGLNFFTPGELTGFTELLVIDDVSGTQHVAALEFPWGPQGAVLVLALQVEVDGDSWTASDFFQVFWDDRIGFEPVVLYTWRPPRFRFTY